MSKHMIIMSRQDQEKVEQLIEEDLLTYCDNVIVMAEDTNNNEMIINMTNLLLADLNEIKLNDVIQYLNRIITSIEKGDLDSVKTEILLCKNYVGEIQVIYT